MIAWIICELDWIDFMVVNNVSRSVRYSEFALWQLAPGANSYAAFFRLWNLHNVLFPLVEDPIHHNAYPLAPDAVITTSFWCMEKSHFQNTDCENRHCCSRKRRGVCDHMCILRPSQTTHQSLIRSAHWWCFPSKSSIVHYRRFRVFVRLQNQIYTPQLQYNITSARRYQGGIENDMWKCIMFKMSMSMKQ